MKHHLTGRRRRNEWLRERLPALIIAAILLAVPTGLSLFVAWWVAPAVVGFVAAFILPIWLDSRRHPRWTRFRTRVAAQAGDSSFVDLALGASSVRSHDSCDDGGGASGDCD